VKKDHIVAIAYEESIGVIGLNDGLINIVKHNVGYQQ
jgi:hypothetical protein